MMMYVIWRLCQAQIIESQRKLWKTIACVLPFSTHSVAKEAESAFTPQNDCSRRQSITCEEGLDAGI
jgi:hypothetical protein